MIYVSDILLLSQSHLLPRSDLEQLVCVSCTSRRPVFTNSHHIDPECSHRTPRKLPIKYHIMGLLANPRSNHLTHLALLGTLLFFEFLTLAISAAFVDRGKSLYFGKCSEGGR